MIKSHLHKKIYLPISKESMIPWTAFFSTSSSIPEILADLSTTKYTSNFLPEHSAINRQSNNSLLCSKSLVSIKKFKQLKWSLRGAAVVQWTATRRPGVRFPVGTVYLLSFSSFARDSKWGCRL